LGAIDFCKNKTSIAVPLREGRRVIQFVRELLTLSLALLLDLVELDSPRILGAISFIGFASSILTIFSFFDAMSQPPKNTVDDVMKLLRTEMKEVKEQINKIEKRLTEQEIFLYQNVEDAVSDAINDYTYSRAMLIFRPEPSSCMTD